MVKNATLGGSPPSILDKLEITSENGQIESLEFDGDGSRKKLVFRAKPKFLNSVLMPMLSNLNSPLKEKYIDTYFCSNQITVEGEKAKSNFCRNRFCFICNRIRTAQLYHNYQPTLDTWKHKTFLTLTVPNVPDEKLGSSLQSMYKAFTQIKDLERKRGHKIVGLRKLECTYNCKTDLFHPHYHIILSDAKRNKVIIDEWLERIEGSSRAGQNFKPADKNACAELFKYFTKMTSNSSKDKTITCEKIDYIFQSIIGVRTFQPFGFIAHVAQPPPEKILQTEIFETEVFEYEKTIADWFNKKTGEVLTNYQKTKADEQFFQNIRYYRTPQ